METDRVSAAHIICRWHL